MSIPWRAAQLTTDEFRPGRLAISTAATPESLLANWLNSRRAGKPCGVCSQDKTVYSPLSEMLRDAANNNLCKVRSQGNRSACCASVSSDRASILSTTSVSPRLRSTPVQLIAAQFDGTEALLCAVVQIVECETDGKCHPATTEGARIPRFLKVNFDKKTITATEESGITDVSAIKNIEHSDDRLIMQGAENGRGWTLVISEITGEMSATVSDDKVGFVVFGACTKD